MNTKTVVMASLAAAVLGACGGGGGGGGDDAPPPVAVVPGSDVPQSAAQSADAAFQFVSDVAGHDEASDPVQVGDATLATTDTEEAKPL
jgi:hypothetical protein